MVGINLDVTTATAVLKPLIIFIVGVVIYSIFIFKFYRFLARKDIFQLNLEKHEQEKGAGFKKFMDTLVYLFKYILVFPIITFFWFGVLALLLSFLSKNADVQNILMIAMALVGAVRVTAYYNEDLSKDLAKMLPFALLGIFLVDVTFFNWDNSLNSILSVADYLQTIIYYFCFVIVLEFILRIAHGMRKKGKAKKEK
ncbi:MAG: hypothetical protein ABIA93_05875 [Candidatus Woesearchaeota archaeon]